MLERVGWLKVSFFATPVDDFLRTGNFANVETLILNAGPFPAVLEAVAENESFRSLRYVEFGGDCWPWLPNISDNLRHHILANVLGEANEKHVLFGEMRAVLRAILRDTAAVSPPPPPPPPARVARPAASAPAGDTIRVIWGLMMIANLVIKLAHFTGTNREPNHPPPAPTSGTPVRPDVKRPAAEPIRFAAPKNRPELEELPKQMREGPTPRPDPAPLGNPNGAENRNPKSNKN